MCLGGGRGWLFSGRLSVQTHGWLGDYAVDDVCWCRVRCLWRWCWLRGRGSGVSRLEELVIEAPLLLPEHGAVAVQLLVGGADEEGRCGFEVYSRLEDPAGHHTGDRGGRCGGGVGSSCEWGVGGGCGGGGV
ncbi:hypothetical protein [Mycobacterium szulgai]|uniref:hypothetical protein n=1 Tax=Mycobacterium szulgai TaxID=1787 RepID=UPI003557A0C8